mgnify:FL=1
MFKKDVMTAKYDRKTIIRDKFIILRVISVCSLGVIYFQSGIVKILPNEQNSYASGP